MILYTFCIHFVTFCIHFVHICIYFVNIWLYEHRLQVGERAEGGPGQDGLDNRGGVRRGMEE